MNDALSGTLLAAVIFSFPAWGSPLSYIATDLGPVTAYGINASGDVVGTANNQALLYHNGTFTFIDSVGSYAAGINASGQIVGQDNNRAISLQRGSAHFSRP